MTKPAPEPSDDLLYTLEDAAKVIGRSRNRLRQAIKAGEIIARRDGRIKMVERSELQKWISSLPVLK